jgi:hypothetical protein
MLKWSPEALVGAVAIGVSAAGGMITTAIHWGVETNQIEHMEKNQADISGKLDQHQRELGAEKEHEASVEQKLDDMISRLDRIEKGLEHRK